MTNKIVLIFLCLASRPIQSSAHREPKEYALNHSVTHRKDADTETYTSWAHQKDTKEWIQITASLKGERYFVLCKYPDGDSDFTDKPKKSFRPSGASEKYFEALKDHYIKVLQRKAFQFIDYIIKI